MRNRLPGRSSGGGAPGLTSSQRQRMMNYFPMIAAVYLMIDQALQSWDWRISAVMLGRMLREASNPGEHKAKEPSTDVANVLVTETLRSALGAIGPDSLEKACGMAVAVIINDGGKTRSIWRTNGVFSVAGLHDGVDWCSEQIKDSYHDASGAKRLH